MKNKKGFTLVELLAVVALLAVLAAVATPVISSVSRKSKEKMYDAKIKMITEAAVLYAEKNARNPYTFIQVKDLCLDGFLTVENESGYDANKCQKNPVNGKPMGECDIFIRKDGSTKRYIATFAETTGELDDTACKK